MADVIRVTNLEMGGWVHWMTQVSPMHLREALKMEASPSCGKREMQGEGGCATDGRDSDRRHCRWL